MQESDISGIVAYVMRSGSIGPDENNRYRSTSSDSLVMPAPVHIINTGIGFFDFESSLEAKPMKWFGLNCAFERIVDMHVVATRHNEGTFFMNDKNYICSATEIYQGSEVLADLLYLRAGGFREIVTINQTRNHIMSDIKRIVADYVAGEQASLKTLQEHRKYLIEEEGCSAKEADSVVEFHKRQQDIGDGDDPNEKYRPRRITIYSTSTIFERIVELFKEYGDNFVARGSEIDTIPFIEEILKDHRKRAERAAAISGS